MRRPRGAPLARLRRALGPVSPVVAVVVAVVVVAAVAVSLVWLRTPPARPADPTADPPAAAAGSPTPSPSSAAPALLTPVPVSVPVAFVGDGLASAASGADSGGDWAARTAATLAAGGDPITVLSAASPGAGFATASTQGLTITQLVDRAVGSGVRVVVIFGGWADAAQPAAAVQAGAQAALAEVHWLAPTATVLLVAPPPAPGLPDSPSVTQGLRQAAVTGTAALLTTTGATWSLPSGTTSGTTAGVPVLTDAGQGAVAARVSPNLAPLVRAARAAH